MCVCVCVCVYIYALISDTKLFLWALKLRKNCSNAEDTAI